MESNYVIVFKVLHWNFKDALLHLFSKEFSKIKLYI